MHLSICMEKREERTGVSVVYFILGKKRKKGKKEKGRTFCLQLFRSKERKKVSRLEFEMRLREVIICKGSSLSIYFSIEGIGI